jgi:hypothetical protein
LINPGLPQSLCLLPSSFSPPVPDPRLDWRAAIAGRHRFVTLRNATEITLRTAKRIVKIVKKSATTGFMNREICNKMVLINSA